ncbi:MAG: fructose 1,6-bisphosphatase [Methanomicrobiaceae archaeon]|nr:fructose 1,6-bisphosphatase [Methanomicrobiaceae archaeon]
MQDVTISVIKAEIGGLVGTSRVHPELLEKASRLLKNAEGDLLIDSFVTHAGDELEFIMTHRNGTEDPEIHGLAWSVFLECTETAKNLRLFGAGNDMLSGGFGDNVKDTVPGSAELEFAERESEPVLIFMADKIRPGSWNYHLYRMFADPFTTPGLILDPALAGGFAFEVHDCVDGRTITLATPTESYALLAYIGAPSRYVVRRVRRRAEGEEIAAVTSDLRTDRIGGRYTGKDDPVMIVRAQDGFPATGELLEPFASPAIVAGWMRGSHHGPLMPVALYDANCTRFDGPPRVACLGFQVADGRLVGPVDMFDDPGFDRARDRCHEIADILRVHGPFEPHRLPLAELEPGALDHVEEEFGKRWKPLPR